MTPKDRGRIAEMLRERLPEGWRVHAGLEVIALPPTGQGGLRESFRVTARRRIWRLAAAGIIESDAYTGRGWRERLVADVVAAVEAA